MLLSDVLKESFKRYKLVYDGTRPDYKIHDPKPYVLAIDDDYNVDNNGRSILGINLNYYKGDVNKLISNINKNDNKNGFRAFNIKAKVKYKLSKDKKAVKEWEIRNKKKRWKKLIEEFPYLGKFIRRYKISGIKSKKRAFLK